MKSDYVTLFELYPPINISPTQPIHLVLNSHLFGIFLEPPASDAKILTIRGKCFHRDPTQQSSQEWGSNQLHQKITAISTTSKRKLGASSKYAYQRWSRLSQTTNLIVIQFQQRGETWNFPEDSHDIEEDWRYKEITEEGDRTPWCFWQNLW